MKIILIIALVAAIIFILLAISGKKTIKVEQENTMCLTIKKYLIIRDSPEADGLSKYTIHRKNRELRFTRKGVGYTLFLLTIEEGETQGVKLVGLDGYGIRDKEFLKYVCDLVDKIERKSEVEG